MKNLEQCLDNNDALSITKTVGVAGGILEVIALINYIPKFTEIFFNYLRLFHFSNGLLPVLKQ